MSTEVRTDASIFQCMHPNYNLVHILTSKSERQSNGCLVWTGAKHEKGYGIVNTRLKTGTYKTYRVHRLSYQLFVGEIVDKLLVLHSCHNRSCFEPNHLRLGTERENTDDMMKAGRHRPRKGDWGEDNPTAKLTNAQVREIKQKIPTWKLGDGVMFAKKFGVSQAQISAIKRNKWWKQIY